ncbi:MAG: glycosyltransferase [Ignavibacterium sp.]|jgi:cellulose synthase/poly-beta-1,6-N-acetylglucosamine synthase-like glycosyltransferase|nr:glycosyltransferase [Ignavibacterium sp.]
MIENILIIIILILTSYYVIFLLKIYFGLTKLTTLQEEKIQQEFISIIVPFRNEENNILALYKNLTNQDYPDNKYEIIFINDSSTDNSLELLESASQKENVFIYSVPIDYSINAHKKRAVRFGIEKSRGEIIVTTDADCIHPKEWLKNLLKFMDEKTGFVSGPVEFKSDSDFFYKMQRLEFAGLVITGAGLIGYRNPIICNAANIAYRKKAYQDVEGFTFQMNLSSGDDELLMQKIHRDTDYKIVFALDKKAIVSTNANSTIKEFYHQRKRWASKGLFYDDSFLLIKLILIFLFYLSLFIQPILGFLISAKFFLTFIFSFLIKIFFEYLVLKKGTSLLFDPRILKPFLITEILQVPYILISGFMGMFGNLVWKNRTIKR